MAFEQTLHSFIDGSIWNFDPITHEIIRWSVFAFILFVEIRFLEQIDNGTLFQKLPICPNCHKPKRALHNRFCTYKPKP